MKKSALIFAAVAFLAALGGTVISPLCTPCLALNIGALAGYLAGVFDKPTDKSAAVKGGALAGALGGLGAALGQAGGSVVNGVLMGPEGTAQFVRQLGLPVSGDIGSTYWVSLVISTACFAVLNIGIMAAMGALGGLLWNQFSNKPAAAPPPAAPMQ